MTEFRPDSLYDALGLPFTIVDDPAPTQVRLKTILISDPREVRNAIHELHQKQFAEVRSWSRLQPIPDCAEVFSISTRVRRLPIG